MAKSTNISGMAQGRTYQVSGFAPGSSVYAEKLHKMGFVIGTPVELAPVKIADPMVIQIRGGRVALRRKEAQQILVEECTNA